MDFASRPKHLLSLLFILSLNFHKLWQSVVSTRLITEVKQQLVTLVLCNLGQVWDVPGLEFGFVAIFHKF